MRAVVQRVSSSKVTVEGQVTGEINKGLLVLLGVTHEDTSKDVDYIIDKTLNLRIFEDENEKMNLSLKDIGGEGKRERNREGGREEREQRQAGSRLPQ